MEKYLYKLIDIFDLLGFKSEQTLHVDELTFDDLLPLAVSFDEYSQIIKIRQYTIILKLG